MARTKQTPRNIPQPRALSPLPPDTQPILRQGSSAVAYHIPTSPRSPTTPLLTTTIALPPYSQWTSSLHFHTSHTEYIHLVQGAISVSLNGQVKIFSARAGGEVRLHDGSLKSKGLIVEVPKYARHEWMRAEAWYAQRASRGTQRVRPDDVRDEVVVEEWTDPSDLGKPLFFWNLNAIITAPGGVVLSMPARGLKALLGSWWVPFQLFVVFWELDNWPVFLSMGDSGTWGLLIEYVVTFLVLFTAKFLGWLVGVRAIEEKRTPDAIWQAYKKRGIQG